MTGQTVAITGPRQRRLAHELVDAAPWGAICNVRKANRSPDQNAKMWAMLSDISRAKPEGRQHTPDVWKALFMSACGHEVQFVHGLDGNPFPVGFRSSKLDKDQMADLITFIDQWGTERGVKWSVE